MAETKINASQTTITASDIGAARAATVLPTASVSEEGKIYQFIGTTTASYTNGYFYKCVSDGADPATYSWEEVEVQASSGGGLPDQTGQSGKFLTTDGTDASWSDKPLVNNATSPLFPDTCLSILGQNNQQGYVTTVGAGTQSSGSGTAVGYAAKANGQYGVAVGRESVVSGDNGVAVGYRNTAGKNGICLGDGNSMSVNGIAVGNGVSSSGFNSISIGFKVGATAVGAIQLGGNANLSSNIINNETGTLKVCLSTSIANTFNYKLLDIDGTIPADRLKNAINKYSTMPTAASTNEGWIVQYTGTTDSTYTHGYLYECVSDGATPTPNYSWTAVQVQAGGGSSLPSQTGNAGKFLTTDGTDASWATINALQNTATGTGSLAINTSDPVIGSSNVVINGYYGSIDSSSLAVVIGGRILSSRTSPYLNYSVVIGYSATISNGAQYNVVIGGEAESSYSYNVCIGYKAHTSNGSKGILLNASGNNSYLNANNAILFDVSGYGAYNNDANTFKIANTNGTFEIMSADGTIPEARLADTTNATAGQVLTLDSNLNAVWATPSGGGASSATATLAVNDWSSNTQTVSVTGVSASNNVIVAAAPASQADYTSAGILCTAQGAGTLSFSCQTVPTNAITVNVLII